MIEQTPSYYSFGVCFLINKATGHLTGTLAGQLAQEAQVGTLILSHLPQYGDVQVLIQQAQERYDGPIQLATNGRVVTSIKGNRKES